MHRNIHLPLVLVALLSASGPGAQSADVTPAPEVKQSCCGNDGADIARLHKIAERLYSQFKPKEAVAELQKIIRLDGRNFEALVKLARAQIDIGDQIPEDGADSKDRKIKEYALAEDYARKAIKVDPTQLGDISG